MSLENVEGVYALSPTQEGMLFHCLAAPHSPVYIAQMVISIQGDLNVPAMEQAWREVVNSHQALRMAFLWEGLESPVQVARRIVAVPWRTVECATELKFNALLERDRRMGFALDQAPLMRLILWPEYSARHRLAWTFHHLISDGWSNALILREVMERYKSILTSGTRPGSSRPFSDYVQWLHEQDKEAAEAFWRGRLEGVSAPTRLAVPFMEISSASEHRPVDGQLTPADTDKLHVFARARRVTPNVCVLGAWIWTLVNYSQAEALVTGVVLSTRPTALHGWESMVGNFIATLPFASRVHDDMSIGQWLAGIRNDQAALLEHSRIALTDIHKLSGLSRGEQLFDHVFVFESGPRHASTMRAEGLALSILEHHEQSHYGLAALAIPSERMRLIIIHDVAKLDQRLAEDLLESWRTALLDMISGDPERPLSDLQYLSERQATALSGLGQGPELEVGGEPLLPHRISEWSRTRPNDLAVHSQGATLTYAELDRRANRVAHALLEQGAKKGDAIGVLAEGSIEMVIGILGALKAGGAYVPLDPTYPKERLEFMARDSGARLICAHGHPTKALAIQDAHFISLEDSARAILPSEAPTVAISSEDLAYIIYTSGSTGTPRGVAVSHGNLLHSTMARFERYKDPVKCFLLLSSFSFDSSIAGIFWTLSQGGCLCVPTEAERHDPTRLAKLVGERGVTHTLGIPSMLDAIVSEATAAWLSELRVLIAAGEACPPKLAMKIARLLPQATLHNEYGPTEATVWATSHQCDPSVDIHTMPIGRPIANARLHVMNRRGRLTPPGVAGELHIAGPSVAAGLRETTDGAFRCVHEMGGRVYATGDLVAWRRDGALGFLGRVDDQIKLRGRRIQLGEIEAVLRAHPAVSDAAVVVVSNSQGMGSPSVTALTEALWALPEGERERMLSELESGAGQDRICRRDIRRPAYELKLDILKDTFLRTPRAEQREWLISQVLAEAAADLDCLDRIAPNFVRGANRSVADYDVEQSALSDDQIMEDWQTPIMRAMVEIVTAAHGDVLEIGFGRGVSATFIQELGVRSHTVVESNDQCVERHYAPWRARWPERDIRLVHGRWQDKLDQFSQYDGVFFHAFPLNEREYIETVVNSVTFAEHFFATAAGLLRPGGAFTYLSTEVDSLSRRHQRALFRHFSSIGIQVQPVSPPAETRDTWWAPSMAIVKAVK